MLYLLGRKTQLRSERRLVTSVSLGCIFGILLQKFIFRKNLPANSVLVSEDKSHK